MQWLIRVTLLRVRTIIVLGEGLRSMFDFESRLAPRIAVVPNGLAGRPLEPRDGKALPTGAAEPVRILFLSNLIESKGFLELLEAVRILVRDRGARVVCHFCGEFLAHRPDDVRVESSQHARRLFEDQVEEHGLQECVVYRGTVSGEEKIRELQEAHFFVLPTRYSNEGQPMSIIEAMAYGCVPIATRYRAIPDLIEHDVTGVLLPDVDPSRIAEAIGTLIQDRDRFAAISRGAVERYRRLFTREAHLERLMSLLEPS
jgi:glycosyltransferase involved in cell wall biosynthesis